MAAVTKEGSHGQVDMHFGLGKKRLHICLTFDWFNLIELEDWITLERVEKEPPQS